MRLLITTKTVDENDQLLGFFIEWIRLFSEKFEKVTVFSLEKGEFKLPENVKVIGLGKYRGAGKLKILFSLWFLSFSLRNNYDAVFVHMNPIWMIAGGFFWKILGKKRFLWYTSGGVTFKLKLAERVADVIFTASKESFRLPSKKVIVTGHGIDVGLFKPIANCQSPIANRQLKILSVGRISPIKNYETLIESAKILKDEGVNFEVTVVGEAPLEKNKNYELRIKNKIKELGLQSDFNFVGKVSHKDLPQYYQLHDIFIHLSKTGSIDKVLLEAMACGIKFLSSNDSFKVFLPSDLIFDENDGVNLAEKIKNISKIDMIPFDGRQYVVDNHNLNNLVDKISKHIQQ